MSTFLRICLYIFAACAALGLLPAAILAARARQPVMIVVSLLVATFVIFVLVALQMTTALRPIVGRADTFWPTEKKFFLQYWGESLRVGDGGSEIQSR